MTELQPSERPAYSQELGLIDSLGEALDWSSPLGAVPRGTLIGPSQASKKKKKASVPPPYKKQARGTSLIIFFPTTYAPTFSEFSFSIGLARPNRGNLGECKDAYWLAAMVDRNEPSSSSSSPPDFFQKKNSHRLLSPPFPPPSD